MLQYKPRWPTRPTPKDKIFDAESAHCDLTNTMKGHSELTLVLWSIKAAVIVSPDCKALPTNELVYQRGRR
jgi:hypothetical protein